ncbi:MAG: tripartite tricarboxylate transporter TctB family protein [Alphaproteobacteria bacterium]
MSFLNRDTWIGLVMLLVAAVYWLEADKIRISPLDGPVGASGLPKTLAYALGVLAVILIIRSVAGAVISGNTASSTEDDATPLADKIHPHLRAIGLLVIGVGYLLIIDWLGYAIAVACLLLAVSLYIGAALNRRTLLVAVGGGIFFHLLFVEFLGISLPAGKILPLLGLG